MLECPFAKSYPAFHSKTQETIIESGTVPQSNEIDKLLHAAGYAGLVWLGGLACTSWRGRMVLTAVLLGYGAVLKMVQNGLPQHRASLLDMAANGVGLGAGLLALAVTDPLARQVAGRAPIGRRSARRLLRRPARAVGGQIEDRTRQPVPHGERGPGTDRVRARVEEQIRSNA